MLGVCGNESTMSLVDLDKLLEEGLDSGRRASSAALDGAHTPSLDRAILVAHGKLAAGWCQHTQEQMGVDVLTRPSAIGRRPCQQA